SSPRGSKTKGTHDEAITCWMRRTSFDLRRLRNGRRHAGQGAAAGGLQRLDRVLHRHSRWLRLGPREKPRRFFAPFPHDPNPKGGLVGGHAGYLWQWGTAVGGLEIDYSATGIKEDQTIVPPDNLLITETISSKIDALGSARARLGWLWTPNLLAYGTAGIGLAHSKLSDSFSIAGVHTSA